MQNNSTENTAGTAYKGPLTALSSLFFIWGFITCLNDILIPHLKAEFTLNYAQAMLIQFCFFTAYFLVSIPSGYLVEKIGYQAGIITGLLVAGTGCLLFYPAAAGHSYLLFLTAFFVLAAGITLLQVAANPYVAILGAADTASSRLTLTQGFNALGTTVAPLFGSLFILSNAVKSSAEIGLLNPEELVVYQAAQASAVQYPYLGLSAVLIGLALIFSRLKLPNMQQAKQLTTDSEEAAGASAWQYRHLQLGALAIFLYVGGEVAIGSLLVSYLGLPSIGGFSPEVAGQWVAFYWGGAMLGRFAGAWVMSKVHPETVLTFNAVCAAILVTISLFSSGNLAMWSILAVGLCNSIMFPTIFSLAVSGLGRHTGQGSGILCAAIVGGAVLPLLQGGIADQFGLQNAFFVPVLCYSYIAFYALKYRQFYRF